MNPYEQSARTLKAVHIADVCERAHISDVNTLDDERRQLVLQGARTKSASDATWELVQRVLDRRASEANTDPFDNL